jgi:membrane-bound lytic murein transglycosylase D
MEFLPVQQLRGTTKYLSILLAWMVPLTVILFYGCASFRPSAKPEYFRELEASDSLSTFEFGEEDTTGISQNLIQAKRHFRLAEQAIGDKDSDQAVKELDQALNYLSNLDSNIDSTNYLELQNLTAQILDSYRDALKEVGVIPDEFVPEGVLAGNEEYYDSPVDMSDWSDFDSESYAATLPDSESIAIFPPVPLVINNKVNSLIEFYQGRGRKVFLRWMERAQTMIPQIQEVLREEGLPEELAYLSMVESGLNPKAYSWAHASGLWQFIKSTGRLYGLQNDWWYDERCDMEKSTRAASRYLKKLYLEFDDWYLALASYNCGELRVQRVIQQQRTRDFWKLWRLPRQTEDYVPSYIAAALIMKDPVKYGFPEFQVAEAPLPDKVWVRNSVNMDMLAKCAGTDTETIKQLNPHILRWCTPPTLDSVAIFVPAGTSEDFMSQYAQIPQNDQDNWVRHRVRSGETLASIARRYGTTLAAIMDVPENNLKNKTRVKVGQFLMIPVPQGGAQLASNESTVSQTSSDPSGDLNHLTYKVRKGDFLGKISKKYGVSVAKLCQWNQLSTKSTLQVGQLLDIWVSDDNSDSIVSNDNTGDQLTHTVQRGESLWIIANRYRVSVSDLQNANNMGRSTRLNPGQVLVIPGHRSGG